MRTTIIKIATAAALATTASPALASVTKSLKLEASLSPADDDGHVALTIVADDQGFGSLSLIDANHPAYPAWTAVKIAAQSLGTVSSGEQSGPHRTSLRVTLPYFKPGTALVVPQHPETRPKDLAEAYTFAQALAQYASAPQASASGTDYVELISGKRGEAGTFFLCVVVDYAARIEHSITLPSFVSQRLNENCAGGINVLERTKLNLDLVQPEATARTDDEILADTGQHLVSLGNMAEIAGRLCSSPLSRNLTELSALKAAGWILASANVSTENLSVLYGQCTAYLNKMVFKRTADILDQTLSTLPLGKAISGYHRSLLKQVLVKHATTLLYSRDELASLVQSTLGQIWSERDSFANQSVSSSDLNMQEFGEQLDANVTHSPDEWLILLLTSERLPASPLRDSLKSKVRKAAKAYIRTMKLALASTCDYSNFDAKCLLQGAFGLEKAQYHVVLHMTGASQNAVDGYELTTKQTTGL